MVRTILDGGMGRELKRIGAPFRQPEWSALALMQAPEQVLAAHQSFIDAGAQVITTNNYAVVPHHIGADRFERDGTALTALSGQLARRAADTTANTKAGSGKIKVGGSIPPLSGSYRPELYDADLAALCYPQIVAALDPYIDLWQAETMSSIEEAQAVVSAVADSSKPLWLGFSLIDDPSRPVPAVRSGESLEAALKLAIEANADALLFNCSMPEVIGPALALLCPLRDRSAPGLQLGGYANAFTARTSDAVARADVAQLRTEVTPAHYAEITAEWERSGANIIGGCCGIGPEHIAAIAR